MVLKVMERAALPGELLRIIKRHSGFALLAALGLLLGAGSVRGQAATLKPDEMAAQLLNAANKAFNEKQYPFAADRFREYLKQFANTKDANAARFGLGIALLEAPQKDYKAAIETLTPVAGVLDFVDRPLALYHLALAHRGSGHEALLLFTAKPQEVQHRDTARQHFTLAAQRFSEAAAAFATRAKAAPAPADNKPHPDSEWVARAQCDQAEALIRIEKSKEAMDLMTALLADPTMAKSNYRTVGLYLHGHASFLQKDYLAAGKSLVQLAPFGDPTTGAHSQYLLARAHHLSQERAEAIVLYEAVVTGYEKRKAAAQQALQNPMLQNQLEERTRLESIIKTPPDYVARASFYWGVLLYEQLKFGDALPRFTTFAQTYPQSPMIPEAQLRLGMCQFELRQLPQALQTLQPLAAHATLGDRALLWLARSQLAAADPNQPQPYAQALNTVIANLTQAAERCNQVAAQDPDAKARRAEILLDLGDAQQLAAQYPAAAVTYETGLRENNVPDRNEEFMQRRATALHLAGQYDPSDQVCVQFQQTYPKSVLLPAVLFRYAENAFVRSAAIEPTVPVSKNPEVVKWAGEAIKRYQVILEKHAEFAYASLAKHRAGMAHYRLGDFANGLKLWSTIADTERNGELVSVAYYHADCLLRDMPTDSSDALAAARQLQVLAETIKLLERFVGAQPNPQLAHPQTADALLKLGYCYQRAAAQIAEPNERTQKLTSARQSFEKLAQQFPQSMLVPLSVLERANCLVDQNDIGNAINELGRFRQDPLKAAAVAPLAYLRLATLQRSQNKPVDAAATLLECRNQFEGTIVGDATRAAWAPLIQYHHGLAVRESGKLADARLIFENLVQRFATSPEAPEAAWRAGQCRREDAMSRYSPALVRLAKPDEKPEEIKLAEQQLQDSVKQLSETAQYLVSQAAAVGQKAAGSEVHQHMLYEAAWCYQALANFETEAARKKLAEIGLKKLQEQLAKSVTGQGVATVPQLRAPEIANSEIPIQPAEQAARDQYKALVASGGETPLSIVARLELAELHARRQEHDPAIALLNDALGHEPTLEAEERLRMRLGACLAEKGDAASALPQFAAVAENPKSPLAADARYRAGECQMQMKNWPKAVEWWIPFRDQPSLQTIAGLSDRALLRLGHALALATQWDLSRQAHEALIARFPQSVWRFEARYGIGWAFQNQNQFDPACQSYQQVVNETATEVAAKAQYQLALCRIEQKRLPEAATALLIVPYTYDYPEWTAVALLEASRVFQELQQVQQARKLLERVVKDYPESEWAKAAQQRLAALAATKSS